MEIKDTDTIEYFMDLAQSERTMRLEAQERAGAAIAAWNEERQRALREASRVIEANLLLEEAFSHVRNIPLADSIAEYLAQFNPPDSIPKGQEQANESSQ